MVVEFRPNDRNISILLYLVNQPSHAIVGFVDGSMCEDRGRPEDCQIMNPIDHSPDLPGRIVRAQQEIDQGLF